MDSCDPATGVGMDDRQQRDKVITLYLAGHETTSILLSRSLYLLGRHPDIQNRVAAEVDAVVTDEALSMEQLKAMQYTMQVIQEVLRLFPPVWTIARNALAEDEIMGYRLPGASMVMVSPYFAHRLAEFWPDPLRCKPERFTPDKVATRHPFDT